MIHLIFRVTDLASIFPVSPKAEYLCPSPNVKLKKHYPLLLIQYILSYKLYLRCLLQEQPEDAPPCYDVKVATVHGFRIK